MKENNKTLTVCGTPLDEGSGIRFTESHNEHGSGDQYRFFGERHGVLARFEACDDSGAVIEVTPKKLEQWVEDLGVAELVDDIPVQMAGASEAELPYRARWTDFTAVVEEAKASEQIDLFPDTQPETADEAEEKPAKQKVVVEPKTAAQK